VQYSYSISFVIILRSKFPYAISCMIPELRQRSHDGYMYMYIGARDEEHSVRVQVPVRVRVRVRVLHEYEYCTSTSTARVRVLHEYEYCTSTGVGYGVSLHSGSPGDLRSCTRTVAISTDLYGDMYRDDMYLCLLNVPPATGPAGPPIAPGSTFSTYSNLGSCPATNSTHSKPG
jgi:hypothetical protein